MVGGRRQTCNERTTPHTGLPDCYPPPDYPVDHAAHFVAVDGKRINARLARSQARGEGRGGHMATCWLFGLTFAAQWGLDTDLARQRLGASHPLWAVYPRGG